MYASYLHKFDFICLLFVHVSHIKKLENVVVFIFCVYMFKKPNHKGNAPSNLRTLKSKSYEQCRTKHKYYNNKAPHFLTAELQIFNLIKVLSMSKPTQAIMNSAKM